jgi:hypothetical protein
MPQVKHLIGIIISYTKLLYYSYIFLFLIQFYFFMFNYIIIIMADFQRDMKRYENLIKNDLLNFKGKNNRVETEIANGHSQYKANVMLWIACARPYIPVDYCEMLIDRFGANPNYEAPFGAEPSCLIVASISPKAEKVGLLLDKGANPEYMTDDRTTHINDTALSKAVESKQSLNCRILMLFGADPNVELGGGRTPLTIAHQLATEDPENEERQHVLRALSMPRSETTTTLMLFINDAMRLGFDNDFDNIEALNKFAGPTPQPEPEPEGGSSRKRKRTKRRKTNKKRRTNRRK